MPSPRPTSFTGSPSAPATARTAPPLAEPSNLASTIPVTPTASVNTRAWAIAFCPVVEDQQTLYRRSGQLAREDAIDLLEFFHQVGLGVQAARGIHDQHVDASGPRRLAGIVDDGGRIGPRGVGDQIASGALRPDGQLVDRRRAEGVGRSQKDGAPLSLQTMGEFADRGRLAGTVHPEHHQAGRRRIEAQGDGIAEHVKENLAQGAQSGCLVCGVAAGSELLQDALRGGGAHVGFDQRDFQLFEELRRRGAGDLTEPRYQLRPRPGEALPQTVESIHEGVGKSRHITGGIRLSNSPTF